MNKKGFTLIELLAVIAVLSIITTITMVSVTTIFSDSKTSINNIQAKTIISSAKAYTTDNLADINKLIDSAPNYMVFIKAYTLVDDEYIDDLPDSVDGNKSVVIIYKKSEKEKLNYFFMSKTNESLYCNGKSSIKEDEIEYCDINNKKITITDNNKVVFKDGNNVLAAAYYKVKNNKDGIVIIENSLTGKYDGTEKDITISNVDRIGYNGDDYGIFQDKGLENVSFKKTYQIGDYMFAQNNLTNLDLTGTYYINTGAFSRNKLTNVKFDDKCGGIGVNSFSRNQLKTVTLPNNSLHLFIGKGAFSQNPLTKIINKSERSFDWAEILSEFTYDTPTDSVTCSSANPSVTNTCTVTNDHGTFTVNIVEE